MYGGGMGMMGMGENALVRDRIGTCRIKLVDLWRKTIMSDIGTMLTCRRRDVWWRNIGHG